METNRHPQNPLSNVNKFGEYDPDKYTITNVSNTCLTHEDLTPGNPPCLTQATVGKYLLPLTKELDEVPPRPTIDELPDAVIEKMVLKDKSFWVDKPGANAYALHDAYHNYGMTTVIVKPTTQDVFPRSYQYDLDCVEYRRSHACDGLKQPQDQKRKPVRAHCRDCNKLATPGLTPFQLAWAEDPGQKRWKYYPDLSATLTNEEIKNSMDEYEPTQFVHPMILSFDDDHKETEENVGEQVGRPYKNEAINWYYKNYPPVKYNTINRKFSH